MPRLPKKGRVDSCKKVSSGYVCSVLYHRYDVPGLHVGLPMLSCHGIVELQSSQASASHGKEGDVLDVIHFFRTRNLQMLFKGYSPDRCWSLLTSKTLSMSVLLMTGNPEMRREG